MQMCMLQQSRWGLSFVHQNDLEAMAMTQVTQLTGKVHVSYKSRRVGVKKEIKWLLKYVNDPLSN